jgi:(2Fe-2S) ferredoxin
MSYYCRHVFFCTNQRTDGRKSCGDAGAAALLAYAKQRAKELKLNGPGKVRVNAAGCLDRCAEGPTIVIYPEAVWYSYASREDIDEIITSHLVNGRIVERLRLPDPGSK